MTSPYNHIMVEDDWEIWIYGQDGANDTAQHTLVASALDRQTAESLKRKIDRLIVIGEAPDVTIYIRRPMDLTYRIKVNGRTVRTRYTLESARALWGQYKSILNAGGRCGRWASSYALRFVQVKGTQRDMRPDVRFIEYVLRGDPVYGRRPLVITDPPFSYFGEPIPYEYVQRVIAGVDQKKIHRIVRRIIRECKRLQATHPTQHLHVEGPPPAPDPVRRRVVRRVRPQ
jgi:hypothetical protein